MNGKAIKKMRTAREDDDIPSRAGSRDVGGRRAAAGSLGAREVSHGAS